MLARDGGGWSRESQACSQTKILTEAVERLEKQEDNQYR